MPKIVAGKRYRVIDDSELSVFCKGDIVIPIESHPVPFCVREDVYDGTNGALSYGDDEIEAMLNEKLEPIEEECVGV